MTSLIIGIHATIAILAAYRWWDDSASGVGCVAIRRCLHIPRFAGVLPETRNRSVFPMRRSGPSAATIATTLAM
jgi:hypothetical protein